MQPNGPTAGFGLRHKGLELDYAFDGRGRLASSQQLALKVDFGQRSPIPTAHDEADEGQADLAQDLHVLLDALDRGDTVTAQAQNDRLMRQVLPIRKEASEAMRTQAVQPAMFNGEFEDAEKSLKMMVKLDRSNAYNYQALGMVEWYLGQRELAVENLKKAYLLYPSRAYLLEKIKAMGGSLPGDAGDKP
jgi:tetratricopeptide (TPR) repeat protein